MNSANQQNKSDDTPKIQNVVATIKMVRQDGNSSKPKQTFDLQEIAQKCRNTQYNPKRFPAVFMRIKDPKATGLIYSSGNMTIVGTRSTNESQTAAERIFGIIKKQLNVDCRFENKEVQVRNIVASCKLGYSVCLDKIHDDKDHKVYSTYDDTFPGLIYRYMLNPNEQKKKNNIIALVFASGKMVFTGAKSQEDIQQAYDKIKPQFIAFQKKDAPQNNAQNGGGQ
ncbi:hypothetical protein ABPG74_022633 [Tetrahymena malaccensis]